MDDLQRSVCTVIGEDLPIQERERERERERGTGEESVNEL